MSFEYNLEKQHAKGKLHAIERINALVDKNSFMEIYAQARHQCTNFGMDKKEIPYDGVITGFGTINGKKVAIYAQDFTVQGGSLGKVHGQKIAELIEKQFGSFEAFKEEFTKKGATLFGSGWVWLSIDKDGKLQITQETNAGNPVQRGFKPLLTFDVWEHAYYIDYQNRRPDHLNALWQIIDWDVVNGRL